MIKVKSARFHSTIFINGAGEVGDRLPSSRKSYPSLEMFYAPDGLRVRIGATKVIVPLANIKEVEIEEEDAPKVVKDPVKK